MRIKNNIKTVAVSGYFNPIHIGHIDMFKEARALGDKLVVIINNDKQVKHKGSTPFMPEIERGTIVSSIRYVDDVWISFDEDKTVCRTLTALNPDIFANGGDRKKSTDIPEAKLCKKLHIKMVFNVGSKGKIQSSSWLLAKANKHGKK